jgi:hypothetical protein
MKYLPDAIATPTPRYLDYLFYSFRVFFGQGLAPAFQSASLLGLQVSEFVSGLIMVALLIGSITRKLSP